MYQQHRPTRDELEAWLGAAPNPAFGIVTGQVSRLVVLDLDCPEREAAFRSAFPHLTQTLTVRSGQRGLPHFYFRIPPGSVVKGLHGAGVDLRAEGQYVVAPGTVVGAHVWSVIHPAAPRLLTGEDLYALRAFVQGSARAMPQPQPEVPERSASRVSLVGRYRSLAPRIGRNNALFNTACFARDHGWPERDVQRELIGLHAIHPPIAAHPPETPDQRRAEGIATIASAYSQPARPVRDSEGPQQLPNAVREALLQRGQDNAARLLDGLMLAGVQPGQVFTAQEAYALVGGWGIGRNTIYTTLADTAAPPDLPAPPTPAPPGAAAAANPSPPGPLIPANAANGRAEETKKMLFGRVPKPGKTPGRPARAFVMPSVRALCALLRVSAGVADVLQPADLASPAAYRRALHVALFRRRPAQYGRAWLAERLGVCKASCRRYERQARVLVRAVVYSHLLDWRWLESVVPDEPMPGTFLVDDTGKRYPPLLALARRLLARKRCVSFKRQWTNHYALWEESALPAAQSEARPAADPVRAVPRFTNPLAAAVSAAAAQVATNQPIEVVIRRDPTGRTTIAPLSSSQYPSGDLPVPAPTAQAAPSARAQSAAHKAQVKQCAERLYDSLRRRDPHKALTREAAHKLVKEFGVPLVERGLWVVVHRGDLRNPPGFLKVWLRAERLRAVLDGKAAPRKPSRRAAPSAEEEAKAQAAWLEKLRNSPYAAYYANAADFMGG